MLKNDEGNNLLEQLADLYNEDSIEEKFNKAWKEAIDLCRKESLTTCEQISKFLTQAFYNDDLLKKYELLFVTYQTPAICQDQDCIKCVRNYLQQYFTEWTSANIEIDNAIQNCQKSTRGFEYIIEWIPYGKGGFDTVYGGVVVFKVLSGTNQKHSKKFKEFLGAKIEQSITTHASDFWPYCDVESWTMLKN
ncbi:30733_t:CDS:2, partial [Gigaspora margarita]